jgi:hypothetical protein
MTCRGVVKGNTILLEDQARLPEGATVEVRVLDPCEGKEATDQHDGASASAREAASDGEDPFVAVFKHRAVYEGRRIGIDEIIEEEKQDREERFDHWLFPQA